MRKSRFKWKVGQSVRFKYYDGSVHNGVVVSRQYRNEDTEYLDTQYNQPMYTCHSQDLSGRYSRGYMVYPSLTQTMIQFELDRPHIIKTLDEVRKDNVEVHNVEVEVTPTVSSITDRLEQYNDSVDEVEVTETLESAIQRQKKFLNR